MSWPNEHREQLVRELFLSVKYCVNKETKDCFSVFCFQSLSDVESVFKREVCSWEYSTQTLLHCQLWSGHFIQAIIEAKELSKFLIAKSSIYKDCNTNEM